MSLHLSFFTWVKEGERNGSWPSEEAHKMTYLAIAKSSGEEKENVKIS